jgi:hypothetical protein
MPTIAQLSPASSVSDSDELPIYQNGQTLAATRAQILAGIQTALTVPAGAVLGGVGPGVTAPVPITIGSNLTLAGTTLSANAAPFEIAALPSGSTPGPTDIVGIAQAGGNVGISYSALMQAAGSVSGVPAGAMLATAAGASTARSVAELAANAVSIEDFGALGDGVTNDVAALIGALATGNPVRFGPKTYRIDGECDITGSNATLIGVAGATILSRGAQDAVGTSGTPTWISVSATRFSADGIIFDANQAITSDSFAVAVQSTCLGATITRCWFRNAKGPNNGWGLAVLPSDPTLTSHYIHDCEFSDNAVDGCWIAATDAVEISSCRGHDNTRNGIYVDSQDPTFILKIRKVMVLNNTCWNNQTGIVIGNFNQTNTVPGTYGNGNPDVLSALVANNNLYQNTSYGLSVSGRNILVTGNVLSNNGPAGGGMLANTGYCRIVGNMIVGAGSFGIDAGGSIFVELAGNYVNGAEFGIGIGGSQNCTVRGNFIQDCSAAIIALNVESDGRGDNFGIACNNLSLIGNWIYYGAGGQGIVLRDAPQGVFVADNVVVATGGGDPLNSLIPYTDGLIVRGNMLNFMPLWPVNPDAASGTNTLVVPDLVDQISISQSTASIQSMVTAWASRSAGQITYIKVINGGSGYSSATVSITGAGTGATASAFIANGVIIGVTIIDNGIGYGLGTVASIVGNGSGAVLAAQVGLPVLQGKSLAIQGSVPLTFEAAGSAPAQQNWTGAPITVPAQSVIDWLGVGGGWQATRFTQSDYVAPNGDGSVVFQSQAGDVALHPRVGGVVRIIADTEPVGCVSMIGRGSPESVISAPPGSSFRNLDGGVGSTFWIKQSGTANIGWAAIA